MSRIVTVIPYQATWPKGFESEAQLVRQALGDNCIEIHHIGSTAVPGLSAKPIIDMIPVVKDISSVDQAALAMKQLGYEVKGEYGMPFRRFFQKSGERGVYNVHVYESGNPEIERYLKFRDWMRTHPDDRHAYEQLKIELALQFPTDIMSYCVGKENFVATIDTKTGFNGLRMVQALTPREWAVVQHLRQQGHDERPIITNNPQQIHLVLYQGATIVGYAHVELPCEHPVMPRVLIVDQSCQSQGLDQQFLKLIQRWLGR